MELSDRDKYERQLEAGFVRMSRKLQTELRSLMGGSGDASSVPESFWAKVESEVRDNISTVILLVWMRSALEHGLPRSLADTTGAAWAANRATETAKDFALHSRDSLATATDVQSTASTLFSDARASRLAATEVSAAQTAGGEAWKERAEAELGRTVQAVWRHSTRRPRGHSGAIKSPCPVCTPIEGTARGVWGRLFPSGPPAHPHCDCFIEYEPINDLSFAREQ